MFDIIPPYSGYYQTRAQQNTTEFYDATFQETNTVRAFYIVGRGFATAQFYP